MRHLRMLSHQLLGEFNTVVVDQVRETGSERTVYNEADVSPVGGQFRCNVADADVFLPEQLLLLDEA